MGGRGLPILEYSLEYRLLLRLFNLECRCILGVAPACACHGEDFLCRRASSELPISLNRAKSTNLEDLLAARVHFRLFWSDFERFCVTLRGFEAPRSLPVAIGVHIFQNILEYALEYRWVQLE